MRIKRDIKPRRDSEEEFTLDVDDNVDGSENTTAQRKASGTMRSNGPFQLSFLDSAAFAAKRFPRQWLVERVFLTGQPAVIGGVKKTLKTSLAVDLAVSLGSGKPFLGHFPVPVPVRVAVLSGESGEAVLQETAQRVCADRKVRLEDCNILWSSDLPQLSRKSHRRALGRFLQDNEVKVVIIDPLYLCLLGGGQAASASNLYEIGPLLRRATRACLDAGATPIFLHHCVKSAAKTGAPPDLGDLSFSGVAEFTRQWLLVNWRSAYRPDGSANQLLMSVGGSAGQSGLWEVDVQEGVLDAQFRGRCWRVKVRAPQDETGPQPRRKDPAIKPVGVNYR